jgi:hypothetical protein
LRDLFLAEGCAFVCMTDHAEYFDAEKLKAYFDDCEAHSDSRLHFVPGLEYECEKRMHILGYGASRLANSLDPQEVIRHIEGHGAISVIAHPKDEFFDWIESFQTLPRGIEAWNSKYDGRYAPRPGTFALVQKLRQRKSEMHAFYGQDLHWKKQFHNLFVDVNSPSAQPDDILQALSSGSFHGQKDELSLPSSGIVPQELLAEFEQTHARSYRMWQLLKRGKSALDRLGLSVPEPIKAQLRRIF